MARLARVVIPQLPHHVIQRGVRSLPIFFSDADQEAYLRLLAEFGHREGLQSHGSVGRPLGNDSFLQALEQRVGHRLRRGRPGRRHIGK